MEKLEKGENIDGCYGGGGAGGAQRWWGGGTEHLMQAACGQPWFLVGDETQPAAARGGKRSGWCCWYWGRRSDLFSCRGRSRCSFGCGGGGADN